LNPYDIGYEAAHPDSFKGAPMPKKNLAELIADIPPWLPKAASQLMAQAEELFEKGATKKEYVTAGLKLIADLHDIPMVPEFIEAPLEAKVIDIVVGLLFKAEYESDGDKKFVRKMRKAKRMIKRGDMLPGGYWNETFGKYSMADGDPTYNADTSAEMWARFRQLT